MKVLRGLMLVFLLLVAVLMAPVALGLKVMGIAHEERDLIEGRSGI